MNTSNTELPHINQHVIECDLRAFTRWLNALVDQTNWLSSVYTKLQAQVNANTEDIRLLKIRVGDLEDGLEALTSRVDELEARIDAIEGEGLLELLTMMNGRIDMLYGWLPVPYGMIDPKGWKFAMGNINVMSDNNDTPSIDGAGIYTSGQIEDNDLYFN